MIRPPPISTLFPYMTLFRSREASDEQLKQGRYRRGEMVGQSGLERLLDEHLRGQDGGERIEVDAMGRPVRRVQQTEPHAGAQDRKSTRLNSSHLGISYAVFC